MIDRNKLIEIASDAFIKKARQEEPHSIFFVPNWRELPGADDFRASIAPIVDAILETLESERM